MIKTKNMSSGSRNARDITGMKPKPASFYLDDTELLKNEYNTKSTKSQGVATC